MFATVQFTDLLLLCSPRLTRAIGVGLTPYRLRALFNIGQLQVLEGDNLETANTFYLCQGAKTVELYTRLAFASITVNAVAFMP